MRALARTAGRTVLRRAAPAALISLAAGLSTLIPAAPQAALAALAATPATSSVSAGGAYECSIQIGKGYCWGRNLTGELGNGSSRDSAVPVAVSATGVLGGKTLTQISAGGTEACALDSAGAAYCWGLNFFGSFGDGSTAPSSVPVAVDTSGVLAGKTLIQISSGEDDVCALDSAGAAYCWGFNQNGGLGDGSTAPSSVPVAVDTSGVLAGKTLTQISDGGEFACALDRAGAAYCWGNSGYGELGDGSTTHSPVPVAVDTSGALAGKTLTQISAGDEGVCALDRAGAAYCWGADFDGELGDGGAAGFRSTPGPVDTSGALAGKTLTQISAGTEQACALASTGAAYCWGRNSFGSLGDGSTADSNVPVAVDAGGALAGKTLTQISAGRLDTCAVDSAGAAYCWGDNSEGELGDGSTVSISDVPVLVGPPGNLVFTSAPALTAAYGAKLAFTITAAGTPPPLITHTGPLPPGVRFVEESGGRAAITGIPGHSAAGPYRLTLTARNAAGTVTQAFTLTITRPPALTAPTAATGTTGKAIRLTIKVTGYPLPALAESGRLPRGLTFTAKANQTAVIAGVPAAGTAGTYPVTITAASSSGTATAHITVTITARTRAARN
jgi:alpha-tubulin suppressor-like RCC1 family protein